MKSARNIYRRFVAFEEMAAAVYLRLASRFSENPKLSSFWLEMAMQEKQHAGLIQFCLCEGLFATDLPDAAEIQKVGVFFKQIEKRAAARELSVEEAFSLAFELEISEINAIYRHLTTTVHNSMYLLRRKIATTLPDHVEELIAAARKFGVSDRAFQRLRQLKKHYSPEWRRAKQTRLTASQR